MRKSAEPRPPHRRTSDAPPGPIRPADRFTELDAYRVRREWDRYEGNALRDLFRELRVRFLERHRPDRPGPVLEVGPGPGRFSPSIGGPTNPRVLLDLSERALRSARQHLSGRPTSIGPSEFVRGDASRPPFRPRSFAQVVLLGNAIGFAERDAPRLLGTAAELVGSTGGLVLEIVVGSGSHARYLERLPAGAVRRLLASPVRAVLPRIRAEGFAAHEAAPRAGHRFRRFSPSELGRLLQGSGFDVVESVAVAPALGSSPERLEAIRTDSKAWHHLLEIEEALGREPERLREAAALLVAARRAGRTEVPSEG